MEMLFARSRSRGQIPPLLSLFRWEDINSFEGRGKPEIVEAKLWEEKISRFRSKMRVEARIRLGTGRSTWPCLQFRWAQPHLPLRVFGRRRRGCGFTRRLIPTEYLSRSCQRIFSGGAAGSSLLSPGSLGLLGLLGLLWAVCYGCWASAATSCACLAWDSSWF